MITLKKNIYNKLVNNKNIYNIYTNNYDKSIEKTPYKLKKRKICIIYILVQVQNKIVVKEILGILEKKKKQNITNLHLICLKKYNNIYFSFIIKESPNIYDIKI